MSRPLVPFCWFGGKAAVVKKILPYIEGAPHKTYVEPFGGSAAVLLNKSPSPVEIYNDVYSAVSNFFRVLRNRGEELVGKLELTPYSREEFVAALEAGETDEADELERARRFFVVARQVIMGLATTATPGRWCVAARQSRRGMALVVSRWLSSVEGLVEVANRLRRVVVEHDDGLKTFARYDSPDTLTYLDPPYPMSTRSGGVAYAAEFSEEQHTALLKAAKAAKGKVLISSYPSELYDEMLRGPRWTRVGLDGESRSAHFHKGAALYRHECLWMNYRVKS